MSSKDVFEYLSNTANNVVVSHLDVGGEDADLEVGGAGGEENVVGVPVQRLLDVLRHPPVVLLVEVADGDNPRSGT
jgi:hypothetical protein